MVDEYLPTQINSGPWITAYSLFRLRELAPAEFILPICSINTPYAECESLGGMLLPPLFHEALDQDLKQELIARIQACFPQLNAKDNSQRVRVVELDRADTSTPIPNAGQLLAFSVDTAVEEHGPHLPLGTDTLQSYSVLRALKKEGVEFEMARPLEYGQLTWGLPFGFSIDITAGLLTRYVANYARVLCSSRQAQGLYVVDVHGSITHREAIVEGLRLSGVDNWAFRWLHEPLAEFASARGDQHAGGVETALVEHITPNLVDATWFPGRMEELHRRQMSFEQAVQLTADLPQFCATVASEGFNGIIGDIENYNQLDATELFARMLRIAREDISQIRSGTPTQDSGQQLW